MRAEYQAFLSRIRAHPMLANKTDTGVRVQEDGSAVRANYLVAFPAIAHELDDMRYTAIQKVESDRFLSFDVRVAAVDADGLMQLVEALTGQVIGHVLTVPGRTCNAIRMATDALEEGTVKFDPVARLMHVTLTFEFWSRRP